MLKNDIWIKQMAEEHGMITNFVPKNTKVVDNKRVISYGLEAFGYDLRLNNIFYHVVPGNSTLDPKYLLNFDMENPTEAEFFKPFLIMPGEVLLTSSIESVRMPDNVQARPQGKSTYSRIGLIVNMTNIDPGYEGGLSFTLLNCATKPIAVYPGEGIAVISFFEGDRPDVTYAEKGGKYMYSQGPTGSIV